MAQIIDALLVTLGLDASNFKKGTDDATKARKKLADQSTRTTAEQSAREKKLADEQAKRAKAIDDGAKRMAQGIAKVRNEALGLFAVFTAGVGLKDFFSNTINNAAALGQQAANLNMSTESLSAWQRANERAGGTAQGMTEQLKESADAIAKYKLGQGMDGGLQKFFQYGGSDSALKDGNSYLLARAKIIGDMYKQDPNKAHLLSGQMGISEEQFNLIKQGPDAILALVAAQEKNSAVSAKSAAEALKLRNQMLDLRDRLESVATRIVLQLAPALEKLAIRFMDFANWIAGHQDDITRWVESAIVGIESFARTIDKAAQSVGGWKNVLIGLAALRIVSMASPLIMLGSALAGVATALGGIATLGPAAVAALAGVVGFKFGYKIADLLFGTDATRLQDKHDAILAGGTGDALPGLKSKDALRAEAAQQRFGLGMGKDVIGLQSKEALKAEAARQMAAAGIAQPQRGSTPSGGDAGSAALFAAKEKQYGLPSGLLDSVWAAESGRGKKMSSPAGAQGHFQFMPDTAKEYGLKNPNDLGESADAAARMYSNLLKRNGGNLPRALAGYNWGQGNLENQGFGHAPKETRDYIEKITASMSQKNALAIANMPTGADANQSRQQQAVGSTSTSDVKINTINVQTQATDAPGIARSISGAIYNNGLIAQSNGGMN